MTNQEFAEECRRCRVDYNRLFVPRETPDWMRKVEEEVKRQAEAGVRAAVRGTVRQFVANPSLIARVDPLLPGLDLNEALQHVTDLRAQRKPIHGLRGYQPAVNLIAAERALRLLIRLERRWQYRLATMNAERP